MSYPCAICQGPHTTGQCTNQAKAVDATLSIYCSQCQEYETKLDSCQKECDEQARLNGMGGERELKLQSQLGRCRRALVEIASLGDGDEELAEQRIAREALND